MIFYKKNPHNNDALYQEVEGLNTLNHLLHDTHNDDLNIPHIYYVSQEQLQLQQIKVVAPTKQHFEQLGRGLAKLHEVPHEQYGFSSDNYIGLNAQKNEWSSNWGVFFYEFRLMYQLGLIQDRPLKAHFKERLVQHKTKIIDFLNDNHTHASLLHGDLWSGNVLFDNEHVYLIDPAVYYGDSEADIAMTQLFGGFDEAFYATYCKYRTFSKGYEHKKVIYNLYHYLNHFNLFGLGYLDACMQSVEAIENF
jgi:fructosamine-3-kinase